MSTAWEELTGLVPRQKDIEGIVFGAYGWGSLPPAGTSEKVFREQHLGFGESELGEDNIIPLRLRGKMLTLKQAKPWLQAWSCYGGYGAPECYAITMWTTHKVYWITQYDGSTRISEIPRNPIDHVPDMPGG